MKDIIEKWELILQKDLDNNISYGRNVLIEMLNDFKSLQGEQEENMECYPAEFVEWLAFKSHGNFNPRFELHKYWDGTVNEWRSVFRKLDGLIWEDITIAELYEFWKTEIEQ